MDCLQLIAGFRTEGKPNKLPKNKNIIAGVNYAIVDIAVNSFAAIADNRRLEDDPQEDPFFFMADLGFVYPATVADRKCNKKSGACEFETQTVICMLASADTALVDTFKKELTFENKNKPYNLLNKVNNYFDAFSFKVNSDKDFDEVEIVILGE
jgi:hypothetical protein